jgi:glycosyltransferase involved in cell wall biosynthesis
VSQVNTQIDARENPVSSRGLRVLVFDEWIPYPPDSGKRVRTWNILRRLARRHDLALLCYGDSEGRAARVVRAAGIDLHTVTTLPELKGWPLYSSLLVNLFSPRPFSVSKHDTRRFREQLRRLVGGNQFDLVHFEWTPYAGFAEEIDGIPTLIMAHNIESQIWARRAKHSRTFLERIYFGLQGRKMASFERLAMERADAVATVTDLDLKQVRNWGIRSPALVENGVDLDEFSPSQERPAAMEILCLGSLDWFPNVDGVNYLIDEVMPLIVARMPAVRLRIVGRRPPKKLQDRIARLPWLDFVGQVSDVRTWLARASVVIVPLRIGGGSRIKILEALAMGKPVVSTTIGAEGLAVSGETHLLLADSPEELARRTIELLKSPELGSRLGEQGRKLVQERYSWDRAADALEAAWFSVCRSRSRGSGIAPAADLLKEAHGSL